MITLPSSTMLVEKLNGKTLILTRGTVYLFIAISATVSPAFCMLASIILALFFYYITYRAADAHIANREKVIWHGAICAAAALIAFDHTAMQQYMLLHAFIFLLILPAFIFGITSRWGKIKHWLTSKWERVAS